MRPIATADHYQETTKEYLNTAFARRLEKEFEVLPYHLRYKALYWTALVFTYLCNVLSFATGSALLFFLLVSVMPYWLAVFITLSVAVVLELAKRKTSSLWAKSWFMFKRINIGLLLVIVALSTLSITASYHGADRTTKELTSEYKGVNIDSTKAYIDTQSRIEILRQERTALENQKNANGQTYYKVLPAISSVTAQISSLESELQELRTSNRTDNSTGETKHNENTNMTAQNVALFSLVCEVLYLLLIMWCKYYRFHSYQTLTAMAVNGQNVAITPTITGNNDNITTNDNNNGNGGILPPVVGANPTPINTPLDNENNEADADNKTDEQNEDLARLEVLKDQRSKVKKKLNTNTRRLVNGIGTPETLRRNIKKYRNEVKDLEHQIKELKTQLSTPVV